MFKQYFTSKVSTIEGLTILFAVLFSIIKNGNQFISDNFVINLTFILLFITMFIFRSNNCRHMLFAFILLILSVVTDLFGLNNITFFTSSLTLSLLILGIFNMVLFKDETSNYK